MYHHHDVKPWTPSWLLIDEAADLALEPIAVRSALDAALRPQADPGVRCLVR